MKQNPSYSQTRKSLIQQVNQLDISTANASIIDTQFNSTATNIKIDNYLKTISQLQSQIAHRQNHIHYCTTVTQWINACIGYKPNVQQGQGQGMKSLMNATGKINVLEKQAITFNSKNNIDRSKLNDGNTNDKQSKCVVSAHLAYVLNPKQDKQQKIKQLIKTRDALYSRIQNMLVKQEPYLHEKIMKKIQKEVKRQTKLQAIKELQSICKQKQKWLNQTKKQINEKVDEKIIEQKVTNNLLKMKQIMNKKIINSEYIGSLAANKNAIDKNISRLQKSVNQIKNIVKQQLNKMDNESLQSQLNVIQEQKQNKDRIVEMNNQFTNQINDLLSKGYSLLCQPLQTLNQKELQQQLEMVSKQMQMRTRKNY